MGLQTNNIIIQAKISVERGARKRGQAHLPNPETA
jgi:hypothetical protein